MHLSKCMLTSAPIISSRAMPLVSSGSDSSKWNVKTGSFNSPGTKSSETANPREKIPDGDQNKVSFQGDPTLWRTTVRPLHPHSCGTWHLQQTGFNVTDVGLNSQRAFLQKSLCLTRSLNSLKVLGWIKSLLILCSNLHLSPHKKN